MIFLGIQCLAPNRYFFFAFSHAYDPLLMKFICCCSKRRKRRLNRRLSLEYMGSFKRIKYPEVSKKSYITLNLNLVLRIEIIDEREGGRETILDVHCWWQIIYCNSFNLFHEFYGVWSILDNYQWDQCSFMFQSSNAASNFFWGRLLFSYLLQDIQTQLTHVCWCFPMSVDAFHIVLGLLSNHKYSFLNKNFISLFQFTEKRNYFNMQLFFTFDGMQHYPWGTDSLKLLFFTLWPALLCKQVSIMICFSTMVFHWPNFIAGAGLCDSWSTEASD